MMTIITTRLWAFKQDASISALACASIVGSAFAADALESQLVVRTDADEEIISYLASSFEKKHPETKVTYQTIGSMESLVKTFQEMPAPEADILTTKVELLIKGEDDHKAKTGKSMFTSYKTVNSDRLDEKLIGPDFRWYTERWFGRAIIVHQSAIEKYGEIKCFKDLLTWGGTFDYADPIKTGAGFSAVLAFIQDFGGWDAPEGGIDFAKQLEGARSMNHAFTTTMQQMFIRKELDAMWNADIWAWRMSLDNKLDLTAIYPCEGTIYSDNSVAILEGAKHPDAAKAWVDHVTSKEVQTWITANTFSQTAATDVELPPEMAAAPIVGKEHIVYDVPWTKIAAETAKYKELWLNAVQH